MNKQLLDGIKKLGKMDSFEREQFEDNHPHDLPLSSGTLAYSKEPVKDVISQLRQYVVDCRQAASINQPGDWAKNANEIEAVIDYLSK